MAFQCKSSLSEPIVQQRLTACSALVKYSVKVSFSALYINKNSSCN